MSTNPQNRDIKKEFSKRRTLNFSLLGGLFLILYIFINIDEQFSFLEISRDNAFTVYMVAFVGFLIYSFKCWRCPSCNRYFGKSLNPKFCSNCESELR